MQAHYAAQDPSSNTAAPEQRQPYVAPVIPMGLPHVVQFVTGSLLDQSAKCQLVGDRMSRYAQADGTVSMAQTFICEISGLGSKNTAIKYLETMRARGILEIADEQGGNDRKSKRYRFLGEQFDWKPVPVERPGTDFRAALYEARQEIRELRDENDNLRAHNEYLQAQLDLLTNGAADGRPDTISHSIRHSEVTNGEGSGTPETASGSYESAPSEPTEEAGASIRHFEVTNGPNRRPGVPGAPGQSAAAGDGVPGLLRHQLPGRHQQRGPLLLSELRHRAGAPHAGGNPEGGPGCCG